MPQTNDSAVQVLDAVKMWSWTACGVDPDFVGNNLHQ